MSISSLTQSWKDFVYQENDTYFRELLVHFIIYSTNIYREISVAVVILVVGWKIMKKCLIIGGITDHEITWFHRFISKYGKTLEFFQMKTGGELFSYNRIRFILTTNPDVSSNWNNGIQWFSSNTIGQQFSVFLEFTCKFQQTVFDSELIHITDQ